MNRGCPPRQATFIASMVTALGTSGANGKASPAPPWSAAAGAGMTSSAGGVRTGLAGNGDHRDREPLARAGGRRTERTALVSLGIPPTPTGRHRTSAARTAARFAGWNGRLGPRPRRAAVRR